MAILAACRGAEGTAPQPIVLVEPTEGIRRSAGVSMHDFVGPAVRVSSLYEARDTARAMSRARSPSDPAVTVTLLPGLHRLNETLALGPEDGGVAWASSDPANPAVVSGGTPVTGWRAHPTLAGVLTAPVPPSLPPGATLRQLWVNGARAERPYEYIPGNLTNVTGGFDFKHSGVDPAGWANPADTEFVFHVKWWTQSRCTVKSVDGTVVLLKQPCILDVN
eukprot:gene5370-5393_t